MKWVLYKDKVETQHCPGSHWFTVHLILKWFFTTPILYQSQILLKSLIRFCISEGLTESAWIIPGDVRSIQMAILSLKSSFRTLLNGAIFRYLPTFISEVTTFSFFKNCSSLTQKWIFCFCFFHMLLVIRLLGIDLETTVRINFVQLWLLKI